MAIYSFDEDEIIEYVPESERDKKDPCIICLRFVPHKKVQKYARQITAEFRRQTNGEKDYIRLREIQDDVEQDAQRKQFLENIKEIKNYRIKGVEVKDPGKFYDTADTDLITDVLRAMTSAQRLSEGQRKNLSGPSDGASK